MRIVIKIGSNVLSREDGSLNITRVSSLVDQIVELRNEGNEVVVVSSGAVACGRSMVNAEHILDKVQQRQLYSAVGQVYLMHTYCKCFNSYGIQVGQILTMKNNFASEEECANQKNCMELMLAEKVVPVVNENDTVCITELMFTDNDELSGLVAELLNADKLIILSDVDGLYDGSPKNPESKLIRSVKPGDDISRYIVSGHNTNGRGGMVSKARTAQKTATMGTPVIIANGKVDNILVDIFKKPEETVFTEFLSK